MLEITFFHLWDKRSKHWWCTNFHQCFQETFLASSGFADWAHYPYAEATKTILFFLRPWFRSTFSKRPRIFRWQDCTKVWCQRQKNSQHISSKHCVFPFSTCVFFSFWSTPDVFTLIHPNWDQPELFGTCLSHGIQLDSVENRSKIPMGIQVCLGWTFSCWSPSWQFVGGKRYREARGNTFFLTPELRLPLYTFGCGLVAVGNEGLYYGSPSKNVMVLVVTVTGGQTQCIHVLMFKD